MRIGIIGAGNIGSNLARRLTAIGHEVRIANSREPTTLEDLEAETGATPAYAGEAAADAEVVIVTIPLGKVPDLPDGILDIAAPGAVVVDTNNYYPGRDGKIEAIEDGTTESRWVANHLGHPVIKAFNGIYAANIVSEARAAGEAGRLALPVAGDDPDAKAKVLALVDEIGFDAVDAGSIEDSWKQQPGTPSYGASVDADGLRGLLADASPERTDEWRA